MGKILDRFNPNDETEFLKKKLIWLSGQYNHIKNNESLIKTAQKHNLNIVIEESPFQNPRKTIYICIKVKCKNTYLYIYNNTSVAEISDDKTIILDVEYRKEYPKIVMDVIETLELYENSR